MGDIRTVLQAGLVLTSVNVQEGLSSLGYVL